MANALGTVGPSWGWGLGFLDETEKVITIRALYRVLLPSS